MLPEPMVTIVVPAFNAEPHLSELFDSFGPIQRSTVEVLIVDDASIDRTTDVAKSLMSKGRVTVIQNASRVGPALSRRKGVDHATGKYIWFIDADDVLLPHALSTMVQYASCCTSDVIVARALYRYPTGDRRIPHPKSEGACTAAEACSLLCNDHVRGHLWNKMFLRSYVTSLEFADFAHYEDLALVAQAFAGAQSVRLVPNEVYAYRLPDASRRYRSDAFAASLMKFQNYFDATLKKQMLLAGARPRELRCFELRVLTLPRLASFDSCLDTDATCPEVSLSDLPLFLYPRLDLKRLSFLSVAAISPHAANRYSAWLDAFIMRVAAWVRRLRAS